jgi:hypothetical protein
MTEPATRRPIRISTDGTSGPYITVSVELLEKTRTPEQAGSRLNPKPVRIW